MRIGTTALVGGIEQVAAVPEPVDVGGEVPDRLAHLGGDVPGLGALVLVGVRRQPPAEAVGRDDLAGGCQTRETKSSTEPSPKSTTT